ncbi:MaoC/PaaZ C-terminal domain-containing protein [Stutzerimonas stutzeri]|uniref:MaoC-like domain-containing protein n=1 Tax=Stutzerimonas stutzeri TaxID=316 RepID=A0A6I6LMJ0_STUST|nr:MaoC/PaaZ C-terminal domain-containing protein [Stutzerimonas stutzeri]QGZ30320.1 hypothetical protein GQA94_09715 [Stutzerimonas stutzeri]
MIEKILYWEHFTLGRSWSAQRDHPVERDEIVEFALKYDPLDIHIYPDQAPNTPLGVHCASGVQTWGMAQRMLCDAFLLRTHVVAGGRMDNFRLLSPVMHGDMLRLKAEVINAAPHFSKDDRGWAEFKIEVSAEDTRVVLVYETAILIMRGLFDGVA